MDTDSSSKKDEVPKEELEEEESWSSNDEDSDDDSDESEEEEEVTSEERRKADKRKERKKKKREEEAQIKKDDTVSEEDLWNFPVDNEHWTEEDLGEKWADYWGDTMAVGYDPELVDEVDIEKHEKLRKEGKGPPDSPFYVPYRKFYPSIPDNHVDIQTPEDVVEELERMEEFLVWVSYVFEDGSSYEGTVWDDLAHGKGVYVTPLELCRYEGEWFQNMMQGHGVLEVDIPDYEPPPDSQEAKKMKAKGEILKSDYMDPFEREWLKMHIEDIAKYNPVYIKPFEDRQEWVDLYGEKPEKGHYKYSGQWKHSRMHGCGVYEINSRLIWGKFYFGELLPDPDECSLEMCAFHSSLAEVAAAKARMFVNKPDGMVRELKGPYTDPSHPYMYEEEDLWMAPGFINAYYEVPKEWRVYVEDLDKEREMWLNSFIKSPLRLPMPSELEYWWSKEDEFVVLGHDPRSTQDLNRDGKKLADNDLEGEVLLHVPTGRIINWANDEEGRIFFFLQPFTEDGEVKPEAIIPLPDGFDEYMKDSSDQSVQEVDSKKKNIFQRFKEGWKKFSEEHEQLYKQRREELERRWKQEDQMTEERMKLKAAERKLAIQIEEEKLYERYQEIYDELVATEQAAQEQSEEVAQEQSEDNAEAKSEEVEEEGTKVGIQRATEDNEGDDQEEEDDKKPKSFGKVAMVEKAGEAGRIFPTTFASLSLAPKMAVQEIFTSRLCKAMAGLRLKPPYLPCQMAIDVEQKLDGQSRIFPMVSKSKFQHVRFSNLRLRSACLRHQQSVKDVHRFLSKNEMKAFSKDADAGRKYSRGIKRCRRVQSVTGLSCWQGCRSKDVWPKPDYGFLSIAVPVEM